MLCCYFFFFFQAEDGIRDHCVTVVQTCALPILELPRRCPVELRAEASGHRNAEAAITRCASDHVLRRAIRWHGRRRRRRSEERRVGKECRSRWSPEQRRKTEARARQRR